MPNENLLQSDGESLSYITVELDNGHPVPEFWGSQDTATGYARILIDLHSRQIHQMEMVVEGMFAVGNSASESRLQQNFSALQPFHFHNLPQGGPQFFVQQLFDFDQSSGEINTASLEDTATGFRFLIEEPYALRPPVNNSALEDVVAAELLEGNGYLGLHTEALPIPATAIAGELIVFGSGSMDGDIVWQGDGRDVGKGSHKGDLLSLGGGDDHGFGRAGDDVIDGGAGNDKLFGNAGNDVTWGGDGDDIIAGGHGDDQLFGNRGEDELDGGNGNDILEGGLGADVLDGGRGDDVLTGGEGPDIFVLRPFSGADTITDFQTGEDSLKFAGPKRLVQAELLDLDGGGTANDTQLTLLGGSVSILNADLTGNYLL